MEEEFKQKLEEIAFKIGYLIGTLESQIELKKIKRQTLLKFHKETEK